MSLTAHFSLEEFTASDTAARLGLDNTPPVELLPVLIRTAQGMERIRSFLGHPIRINSAYRSPALNQLIGSKPTSQHCKGEAVDFTCPGYGDPAKVCRLLKPLMVDLSVDQLILEFPNSPRGGWVHCSFSDKPRHLALTIDSSGTRTGIA